MLTGVTEPLEFTFIFVAPLMYAVHCVYAVGGQLCKEDVLRALDGHAVHNGGAAHGGLPEGHIEDVVQAEGLGITTLQMGVFGGIIVGLGVAALHNRFYKIQLPQC